MQGANFVRPASDRYCWCDDCGGPTVKGRARERRGWQTDAAEETDVDGEASPRRR